MWGTLGFCYPFFYVNYGLYSDLTRVCSNVLFHFQGRIRGTILHSVAMSPLIYDTFWVFPCVVCSCEFQGIVRYFVESPSFGARLIFLIIRLGRKCLEWTPPKWLAIVMPPVRGPWCQHDLSLVTLTLITGVKWHLPEFSVKKLLFSFPSPALCKWVSSASNGGVEDFLHLLEREVSIYIICYSVRKSCLFLFIYLFT